MFISNLGIVVQQCTASAMSFTSEKLLNSLISHTCSKRNVIKVKLQ